MYNWGKCSLTLTRYTFTQTGLATVIPVGPVGAPLSPTTRTTCNAKTKRFLTSAAPKARTTEWSCWRAFETLRWIRENAPWPGVSRVQVITDSLYVKENIARSRSWKKNDWRNQFDEPKENWDLWKQFISAHQKAGMSVSFEWTAGKKSPILKQVHNAAQAAAKRGGTDVDRGYSGGQVARSMVKGAATRFAASGQTAIVRIYRKNVMASGENKVRFDVVADDLQSYTASCYAFASPEICRSFTANMGTGCDSVPIRTTRKSSNWLKR